LHLLQLLNLLLLLGLVLLLVLKLSLLLSLLHLLLHLLHLLLLLLLSGGGSSSQNNRGVRIFGADSATREKPKLDEVMLIFRQHATQQTWSSPRRPPTSLPSAHCRLLVMR
jgi:hypothetical protein